MVKTINKFDWNKYFKVTLMELGSFISFGALLGIVYSILMKVTPATPPNPNMLFDASLASVKQQRDEFVAFLIIYLVLFLILVIGTFFLVSISRKLIWEYIHNNKFTLKGFWKYSVYNSLSTVVVFGLVGLVLYLKNLFLGSIVYLLSSVHEVVYFIFFQMIPFIVVYYLAFFLMYVLNYYYIKKPDFKSYKELKGVSFKKYIKPMLIIAGVFYLVNFILYLKPNSMLFYIFGLIALSCQVSIMKFTVERIESGQKVVALDKKKKVASKKD